MKVPPELGVLLVASNGLADWFLGSGPDRGRSPVEWGEIPSVHTDVHLYIRPPP